MDIKEVGPLLAGLAVQVGLRILGAIALWIVGRMIIGFVVKLIRKP